MKIINASYEILTPLDGDAILQHIERIGRVCYKSEDRITKDSAPKFVQRLIESGHEAMIEHYSFSVKFICDRGISHEIVRHRLASFAQESTRYANYSKEKFGEEITVIAPCYWEQGSFPYRKWECVCKDSENVYLYMLMHFGNQIPPQEARAVLPNSLKTELVMTANLREWRHFLKLRTAKSAHPQMRELACPLLDELKTHIQVIFDDIDY